jgi:hypothetical protein
MDALEMPTFLLAVDPELWATEGIRLLFRIIRGREFFSSGTEVGGLGARTFVVPIRMGI